ncbi:MAG: hypothetical protein GY724_13120 [Actinomycetia bacterium]|nr:hypothetical protein [Actinomycetes bacterium]MCP4226735.1 hypothetical protein [Actinomycetes bacterium]MCP5031218.1 hypothetical protein [Actinomycetes bacterium]
MSDVVAASGPDGSRPVLSDEQVVVLAAVVWIGAVVGARYGSPMPLAMASGVAVLGVITARPLVLVVGTLAMALALGHQADEGYQILPAGNYRGEVSVVSDPRLSGPSSRVEVALGNGKRVEATGFGSVGATLARLSAGDRVSLIGRLRPISASSWTRSRHLVGRLVVDEVGKVRGPNGLRSVAERVRSLVAAGSDPIEMDRRPLYLGLVIGDDRDQSPAQRARFRAAGLSHLLAVSGQNVAFVLSVARPGVTLLPRRARLVAVLVLLLIFATVTRFEPSVLRATSTAGLAAWATMAGRPQSAVRLLGLAVAGLVVVDPFLVHSVGFQLSVGASAGIVVVGPLLVDRLRGPAPLIEPLAVTVAAQLGVLPLLLFYFGPVSMASIPANLMAGWAAGLVMMAGLTVGVVAGLIPGIGSWLQVPATGLLLWLDAVAAWGSRLAAPLITPSLLLIVVGLGGLIWLARGRPWLGSGRAVTRMMARFLVGGLVAGLVLSLVNSVPKPPTSTTALTGGGYWIPAVGEKPSILVVSGGADRRLLDEILGHRIGHIDVVISEEGNGVGARTARGVAELAQVGLLLGPPQHRIVGATRLQSEVTFTSPIITLQVTPEPTRLTVTIQR